MENNNSFFRKKKFHLDVGEKRHLNKTLGAFDLTMLGVGAVVGAGIFILPGKVASVVAGPGIIISFIIAGLACCLAALCYSEFASKLPIAGSAYTYSYHVFGEGIAWILGWSLLLEYGLAVAAIASGWASYVKSLLAGFSLHIPEAISGSYNPSKGVYFDLLAFLVIIVIGILLSLGIKESTRVNNIMVLVKVAVVVLFIIVGVFYVKPDNWTPFLPFGVSGVITGASTVFFAYIGFDAVSTASEEVKNPQRNMPIGIIASLAICTLLYILLSAVLTGIVPFADLEGISAPVAFALQAIGQNWFAGLLSLGAIVGMTTVILVMSYGGTRLLFAMGRDGLLPESFSKLGKRNTPVRNTLIFAILMGLVAGLVPLEQLAELINIGTLFAFSMVSLGIFFLRKNKDLPTDGFKTPLYPFVPALSFILCVYLILNLSAITWISFAIWFVVGLIVYFSYGRQHSKLKA
ncbi:amino acid permease [Listeria booriae]|uniref:Amino acid permease n=1 Tax=Listeria booriae TaxID=1552123 RepID=A0A7X0XAE5_9LIST|nr:amino acid permease [Listeria booriae]MBC1228283.1 amino acid permease [Listeria booriae]MBC1308139.1 amino acid permease [Listeria booriae]MBC1490538.1 amino acid permease [Listeria booriae]MBC1503660.1 amino acid permease [Listeria booriae]MBC1512287.1 amino acid permease [Listeria booriae]